MTELSRAAMSESFASVPRYNIPKPTDPFMSEHHEYKRRPTIEAAHELLSINNNNSPLVKDRRSMIPPVEDLPLAAFNRGVSDGVALPSAFNSGAAEAAAVKGFSSMVHEEEGRKKPPPPSELQLYNQLMSSGRGMTAVNDNVKKLLQDLPMALNAATEATRVKDDGRSGMTAVKRSMTPPIDELPMAFIRAAAEAVVKKDIPMVHGEGKKKPPPPQPVVPISTAATTAAQTNPPRRSVPFKKRKIIHQYHSEGEEEVAKQHPAVAAGWTGLSATNPTTLVNTVTVSSQTPVKNTVEVNQETLLSASQSKRSGGKSSSSSEGGDSSLDYNAEQQQQESSQTPVPEFLTHLHSMLTNTTYNKIISWSVPTQNESTHNGGGILNKGKIIVHNPQSLQDLILGRYYNHSKYSSFQRQLNYFGFKKKLHNGLKGKMSPCSYIHESLSHDVGSLFTLRRRNPSGVKRGVAVDDAIESPYIEMSVSKDGSLREELKSVNNPLAPPTSVQDKAPSVQGKKPAPTSDLGKPPAPPPPAAVPPSKQVTDNISTNEISRRDAVELAARTTHRVNDAKDLAAAHELLSLFNSNSSHPPPPPPQVNSNSYSYPPPPLQQPQSWQQRQQPLYKDQPWPKDDESSSTTSSSTTTIKITAEELAMLEKKRPKRPLSAFNLYYRYKRTKIIEAYESSSSKNAVDSYKESEVSSNAARTTEGQSSKNTEATYANVIYKPSFTSDNDKTTKYDEDTPMCKDKIQELITATPGLESITNLADIPPERLPEIARTEIHSVLKDNLSPTKGERQHRKSNGVGMTFVEMSKSMSTAWKYIDEVSLRIFEELAEQGRKVQAAKVLEYEKLLKEMGIDQKQLSKAKSQQKKKKGGAAKKAPSQQVQHGVNCNTEGYPNVAQGGGGTGERSGCSVEGCTNQAR